MERYRDIIDRLPGVAEEHDDIDAIAVVGSQSRRERPADQYSDLDLVIFCRTPGTYLDDTAWLDRFGGVVCTFTEPTVGGYTERRVLYRDNRDIDVTVLPAFDTCAQDLLRDTAMGRDATGAIPRRSPARDVYERAGYPVPETQRAEIARLLAALDTAS
ncbi:MAG: aminoglycoside 6-adenylyltransferase [Spirochaetales bacterium]|nr:aminoglycoside 6-adenylyltransferase [Spirochaetales bacterium]